LDFLRGVRHRGSNACDDHVKEMTSTDCVSAPK
jgi:hypothetical protein